MKRARKYTRLTRTMEALRHTPPGALDRCNAIGWNGPEVDALPILIDADGEQRDANGLFIVPYKHNRRMTRDELQAWARDNGVTML